MRQLNSLVLQFVKCFILRYLFIVIRTLESGVAIFSLVRMLMASNGQSFCLLWKKTVSQSIIPTLNEKVLWEKSQLVLVHDMRIGILLVMAWWVPPIRDQRNHCNAYIYSLPRGLKLPYKEHMVNKNADKTSQAQQICGREYLSSKKIGAWLIVLNFWHVFCKTCEISF